MAATLAGGATLRASVVTVGGRRYTALAVPARASLARVTAYDAAGRPLGTAEPVTAGP